MSDVMSCVIFAKEGMVATISLARPDKLNALNLAMLQALEAICDKIDGDREIRVAILRAEGKCFCVGGDVKAWGAMGAGEFGIEWVAKGQRVFNRLASLRVPLIAILHGAVLGGGLELAATADIIMAEEGATFGLPEASLGMVPGWSGTQRLVRRFGARLVRRMALGGEVFTVEQGLALGLVDTIVAPSEGLTLAKAYAARVAERSPTASEAVKLMIGAAEGENREQAIETLSSLLVAGSTDLKEGVASFMGKRKPVFQGRW